ncbi:tetratricopeptide (TPR) repeat protein [Nocardiopsis mwathae]|uniref:Tetratricopeptide (TPR) repeat protein n=1 Tax=Nocardiopsis mwathae TaxID=1472723 RepID=A0A7W9YHG2_9ACTN|nr:tetratricopeptide repeat protein [Nocardiopsis mwathae]MBB6171296.1 tetratricopeptide (TPR) repeat protein [Nocardiopsis mwathae]
MSVWRALLRKTRFVSSETRANGAPSPVRVPTEGPGQTPALRAASLERTLKDHIERLGTEDPRSITARNNLASKYAQIGRREAAVAQFELALDEAARAFGEDHPQTDVIRENLAWSYGDVGRHADAAEQWEALLKHRHENLGPVAADTVTARSRLAVSYRRSGRHDAAIAHFERAIEDAAVPEDRENLRLGLSLAYNAVGRFDDTIQQLRMVLAQRRRRLGSRHLDTLVIHHRLGRAYTQAGRSAEAVETLQAAYRNALAEAGDPEIRMLTMKMRRDLAGALSACGRHREAASLF